MALVAAAPVAIASVAAGVGVLYLLRGAGGLGVGPRVSGALPLERLARADSQPLHRMPLAWAPAGAASDAVLVSGSVGNHVRP